MAVTVLKDREQHVRRAPMTKRDKFGRTYPCTVDTLDPVHGHCGLPHLDGKYRPAVEIPPKYLKKVDPNDPFTIQIDFTQWKIDWRERMNGIAQRTDDLAQVMYPQDYGEKIANPTPELLRELGPLPIPLEFIEACEVGNRWALGIPREDGTYYPRPKWATDDLWAQYQLLRASGYWSLDGGGSTHFALPDPSKYADEDDEPAPAKPRGPGGKFAKSAA